MALVDLYYILPMVAVKEFGVRRHGWSEEGVGMPGGSEGLRERAGSVTEMHL